MRYVFIWVFPDFLDTCMLRARQRGIQAGLINLHFRNLVARGLGIFSSDLQIAAVINFI
jgi:hypothetical protein